MSGAAWWERAALVVAAGWHRAKDKAPDRTGRRIIGQAWRELSPAARRILARHVPVTA